MAFSAENYRPEIDKLLEEEAAKAEARNRREAQLAVEEDDPEPRRITAEEARQYKQQHEARKLEADKRRSNGEDRHERSAGNNNSDENRYNAEREENDQRRSRKSRDLVEDEEMREASDKGSANESGRDRRRSRSVDSGNRSLHSSSTRDPPRHDNGDYYRGGGRRSANYNDDDRYRPGGDDRRHRDHHRERSPRRRDNNDRSDRDYRRRSPDRARRPKTPEPTDDERDRRTIFVQQLANRLRTRELKQFFEQVGVVVDAQIVKDRVSGRSKGVGYVEFKDEESVEKALEMTGHKLLGIPIIAQLTEAEKNRQARNTEPTATQSNGVPFHRLYVGNIHFSIDENDLKNVFEPFGELDFVQLQKEEQGRSKGYGFVQFMDATQAKEALEKMNGFELAGRPIRVGLGNDKFTPESTQSLLQRFQHQNQQAANQESGAYGRGGRGMHAGGTSNFDRASGHVERAGGASALDDTDVSGVSWNNVNRHTLMTKLSRTAEPEGNQSTAAQQARQQKPAVKEEQGPTRCILIKNMFDVSMLNEPGFVEELTEDVREELNKYEKGEQKFPGGVVHVAVGIESADGEVYAKFASLAGSKAAWQNLNGRAFDHRILSAQYVADWLYNAQWPESVKL